MPFQENEYVYLVDQENRKHWLKVAYTMLKISSLGTIDGNRFKDMDDGSSFEVAKKRFTVFRPGTYELMESLDRGAQIITPKDAASILYYCDVRAGSVVLEVGAGSGGLTTALQGPSLPTEGYIQWNSRRRTRNAPSRILNAQVSMRIGHIRSGMRAMLRWIWSPMH